MRLSSLRTLALAAALSLTPWIATPAWTAQPSAEQALTLVPLQEDVDYDMPSADEIQDCTIGGESEDGVTGWVVRDPNGRILRRFLDTNGNNKVDLWCYYKDGIEVYRDVDSDFNGKADQYRWLGTAGTRWGIDENEDGTIDRWKVISAEEATAEVVAALRDVDAHRFQRLLPRRDELQSLGLSDAILEDLQAKVQEAADGFEEVARRQRVVGNDTRWVHFGGGQPGVIPARSGGTDLYVYDNVAAVVETNGDHAQVGIGTMIRVGETWRVIGLPTNLFENEVVASTGGYFFQSALRGQAPHGRHLPEGINEELQELIGRLEQVDRQLIEATDANRQAQLNAQRADVIESLIEVSTSSEERGNWIRQFADTVSAAAQSGTYPEGVGRLQELAKQLNENEPEHAAYVKFRYLTADYGLQMQEPSADFAKIQAEWMENLEQFVGEHPDNEESAEAMLQLAIANEFAGEEEEAVTWYGTIAERFPDSEIAEKAAGAKRRLESVGNTISLRGETIDGRSFDLSAHRGRVVVLHYWATWCEPCKQDLETLRELQAQHGRQFTPVGISLDSNPQELRAYLQSNRVGWPQLFEEGGLDSRLANEMGILSLPTMILIDQQGRVVNRSIHASQLQSELEKLLR